MINYLVVYYTSWVFLWHYTSSSPCPTSSPRTSLLVLNWSQFWLVLIGRFNFNVKRLGSNTKQSRQVRRKLPLPSESNSAAVFSTLQRPHWGMRSASEVDGCDLEMLVLHAGKECSKRSFGDEYWIGLRDENVEKGEESRWLLEWTGKRTGVNRRSEKIFAFLLGILACWASSHVVITNTPHGTTYHRLRYRSPDCAHFRSDQIALWDKTAQYIYD